MTEIRIDDKELAYRLAVQEDRIRNVLGRNAEGEQPVIDVVSEFLVENPDCTTTYNWGKISTSQQVERLGLFVGKLGIIGENPGINDVVIWKIFSDSDLFKPFYMLPRDIRFAQNKANEVVNQQYPDGNYRAYDVMDDIFRYLKENKPPR